MTPWSLVVNFWRASRYEFSPCQLSDCVQLMNNTNSLTGLFFHPFDRKNSKVSSLKIYGRWTPLCRMYWHCSTLQTLGSRFSGFWSQRDLWCLPTSFLFHILSSFFHYLSFYKPIKLEVKWVQFFFWAENTALFLGEMFSSKLWIWRMFE